MRTRHPKVTALVPSYNHGRYIRERIESILNQTYSNIELIVIDDLSDDDSHTILSELQARHGFLYLRNERNSGTPFAAWERISTLATGDYIWICESDDVAEPDFVETAVSNLVAEPEAMLFYCNSFIIDEASEAIDHTHSYFHNIWKESRWDTDFSADGLTELLQFQLRGQTVPNMSSALITTSAFRAAFTPFLKRLHLTGDWLFLGEVMKLGKVVFSHSTLNRFRKHEGTSRVRVKSARSQAEFILTKYRLFRGMGQPVAAFATLMGSDVIRFLYESASWRDVVKALIQVSWFDTLKFGGLFFASTCRNTTYISKFKELRNAAATQKDWKTHERPDYD
jgi:glycosyltransferase involved in cell wall biosynthesis